MIPKRVLPMPLDSCFAFGLHSSSDPVWQALNSLTLVKSLHKETAMRSVLVCHSIKHIDAWQSDDYRVSDHAEAVLSPFLLREFALFRDVHKA